MAVSYAGASESHTGTTGSTSQASFTWNHTPSVAPRAALVFVFTSVGTSPQDTGVTYGGVSMTAVPYYGFDTDTEPGGVRAYFLDNIPNDTTARAVVVSRNNNTNPMYAVCYTVAASRPCQVGPNVYTRGGSGANTNATTSGTGTGAVGLISVDDGSPGTNSLRFLGQYYGGAAPLAAGTGSTAGPSIDFGNYTAAAYYETTAGQGARNVGSATGTDDQGVVALAIRETPVDNRNAALGTLTGTASLSAAGTHAGTVALGTFGSGVSMSAQGRKGVARTAGTISAGTSQAMVQRKGGLSSYGSGGGTTVGQDDFSVADRGWVGHTPDVGDIWSLAATIGSGTVSQSITSGTAHLTHPSPTSGVARQYMQVGTADGDADALVLNGPGYSDYDGTSGWFAAGGPWLRGATGWHAYQVDMAADGSTVALYRMTSSALTGLASGTPAGYDTGDHRLWIRMQASGSSPTTLKVRAWWNGTTEPATWLVDTTDNTASNQRASGRFGIQAVTAGDSATVEVTEHDEYVVIQGGGGGIQPGVGILTAATTQAAAGAKGVDNRNAALGNLAVTASLATPTAARKGAKATPSATFGTSQAAQGRKAVSRPAGAITSTGSQAQATPGRKGAKAALGALSTATSMSAAGAKGVDNRNVALGTLTAGTSMAAGGRKAVSRAAGAITATTSQAQVSVPGKRKAAGTITSTASLASGAGRKGGRTALGNLASGTTQAAVARKGAKAALGTLAATPGFSLVGTHAGNVALGTLAVGTSQAAAGYQGTSTNRNAALGNWALSTSMTAAGRKGVARTLGTITSSATLASGLGRKGAKAAAVAAFATAMAAGARKGGRGQATMPLGTSQAAQARTSRYGAAHQSAGTSMAVLGLPGRAGAAGIIALAYDLVALGAANQRHLTGLEVAGSAQDAYAAGLASGDALAQLSGDTSASTRQDTYQARITEG